MKQRDMLSELLDAASDRLAAYGYLLTGSQHAGEDLVQDAIVKVFVRQRRLESVQSAEAYVRAAMRTLHIDKVRRESHWRSLMPRLVERGTSAGPEVTLADQDRVGRALARLAPQERAAVVLRYFDDLKVTEIAAHMHLAEGTVKRYLSNALDKLAGELGRIDDTPERIVLVERKN